MFHDPFSVLLPLARFIEKLESERMDGMQEGVERGVVGREGVVVRAWY